MSTPMSASTFLAALRNEGLTVVQVGDWRTHNRNHKDPWPEAQLEAIERAAAAVCRHHGWTSRSVIGHKEWQPGKIDPRGFTMDSMRARIHDRLK